MPANGLSPRLRGNHPTPHTYRQPHGSIPALAGEPQNGGGSDLVVKVYPRACGGTLSSNPLSLVGVGLSPRLRGNPKTGPLSRPAPRSIPALAGEPAKGNRRRASGRVYPRACGGTGTMGGQYSDNGGLSPRLRGNRVNRMLETDNVGSIPALAGEPPPVRTRGTRIGVYPRACGGTTLSIVSRHSNGGLSPRLRGNHHFVHGGDSSRRSIPALAGEPLPTLPHAPGVEVYPRACGGTPARALAPLTVPGLSPRLRGNLVEVLVVSHYRGSIPALAGEPSPISPSATPPPVYPRACGGTQTRCKVNRQIVGLSPRLRGNLVFSVTINDGKGSIPALAGEPPTFPTIKATLTVYPRACGGT